VIEEASHDDLCPAARQPEPDQILHHPRADGRLRKQPPELESPQAIQARSKSNGTPLFFRVRDHSHGEHRSTPHVPAASLSPSFPFRPHPPCGSTAVVASLIFESRWDVQRQFQSAFSTPNHENIDITTRMVFSENLVRHIINSATYRFVRPPDAPTRLNPK